MWNHSVPYILKQLIDVVSQPGMVFGFDPVEGYTGLLRGKRAAVLYTSAVWGPGKDRRFGVDLATPYLEEWLRWAGVDDIASVEFRPNLVVEDAEPRRLAAHARAASLARSFAGARAA
jgi:FMN-dependent NADH-azoreductase